MTPHTGVDFLAYIFGAVFTILIVGLLIHMIKGWFDSVKSLFLDLKASVDRMYDQVQSLFNRSEIDRLAIKDCQLNAAATYATKSELRILENQIQSILQHRRENDV